MLYLKLHHIYLYEFNLRNFSIFPDFSNPILSDITLNIADGEIFGIVGPSGCGKTVLLKTIAGLIRPQSGEIYIKDKEISNLPPHKRSISMVFQSFVLYPNMTGSGNINFPVQLHIAHDGKNFKQKISPKEIAEKLHLDEEKLLKRYPRYTSLGERQRIAIGKALASSPDLLLLDEPLSNVEDSLRNEIRHQLRKFIKESGITAIYVTHNQIEIGEIADNIAVMQKGKIEQVGTYEELYNNPKTLFVSTLIGEKPANVLKAEKVYMLTDRKINYTLTIRPGECSLNKIENSICISGKISFIESFIQENKKIAFIEVDGELFGVETPLDYPLEEKPNISIYIPLSKAKFFDEKENPDSPPRVYNLW